VSPGRQARRHIPGLAYTPLPPRHLLIIQGRRAVPAGDRTPRVLELRRVGQAANAGWSRKTAMATGAAGAAPVAKATSRKARTSTSPPIGYCKEWVAGGTACPTFRTSTSPPIGYCEGRRCRS
jgi:hypothetical protein